MKKITQFLTLPTLVTSCFLLLAPAEAALILSVDFNGGGGPTETGFQPFAAGNSDLGVASSNATLLGLGVTLSTSGGNLFARNRGGSDSGALTYAQLYGDWISGASNQALVLSVSGLTPSTQYSFTYYTYDSSANVATTQTFTDTTGGGSVGLGSIAYTGNFAPPTSNSQFSLTANTTTDVTGAFQISMISAGGQTRALLSGLEISSVPEPRSVGLLLATWFGAMVMRRRAGDC